MAQTSTYTILECELPTTLGTAVLTDGSNVGCARATFPITTAK